MLDAKSTPTSFFDLKWGFNPSCGIERAQMRVFQTLKRVLPVLVTAFSAGCSNPHKQLGGTDIPVVPQLDHVDTAVVDGSKSKIEAGTVTFRGTVYDALERARWSVSNFEHNGWNLESITGTQQKATAVFGNAKVLNGIQRVATLVVTADRRNGTAVIHFSNRKVPAEPETTSEGTSSKPSSDQATSSLDSKDVGSSATAGASEPS